MDKKSPKEKAEDWKRRSKEAYERNGTSMIPHSIGRAVVALVKTQQTVSTENIIKFLKEDLQCGNGDPLSDWSRDALTWLQDSIARQ